MTSPASDPHAQRRPRPSAALPEGSDDGLIRVLVADGVASSRHAVAAVLDMDAGICVVGTACNGRSLVELVDKLHPEVVVTDLRLPILSAKAAIGRIKQDWPNIGVVVLSLECCAYSDALMAGADEFVAKGEPAEVLVRCVHAAADRSRGTVDRRRFG
jgi:DNA-binding NarL/FixJ family response regulator